MPTMKNVDGQNVERKKADWDKTSKGKYADWDNRSKIKNIDWDETSKSKKR
jgi:hypothetical protein